MVHAVGWAENAKLENIHFLCSSNNVSALEMAGPIVDDLLQLEKEGIIAFDAHLQMNIFVVAPVFNMLADNPRSSELTNHIGFSARRFCRMCMVCHY